MLLSVADVSRSGSSASAARCRRIRPTTVVPNASGMSTRWGMSEPTAMPDTCPVRTNRRSRPRWRPWSRAKTTHRRLRRAGAVDDHLERGVDDLLDCQLALHSRGHRVDRGQLAVLADDLRLGRLDQAEHQHRERDDADRCDGGDGDVLRVLERSGVDDRVTERLERDQRDCGQADPNPPEAAHVSRPVAIRRARLLPGHLSFRPSAAGAQPPGGTADGTAGDPFPDRLP